MTTEKTDSWSFAKERNKNMKKTVIDFKMEDIREEMGDYSEHVYAQIETNSKKATLCVLRHNETGDYRAVWVPNRALEESNFGPDVLTGFNNTDEAIEELEKIYKKGGDCNERE